MDDNELIKTNDDSPIRANCFTFHSLDCSLLHLLGIHLGLNCHFLGFGILSRSCCLKKKLLKEGIYILNEVISSYCQGTNPVNLTSLQQGRNIASCKDSKDLGQKIIPKDFVHGKDSTS
ncbi:unnamed protein product [Allacma fusca]|uniref:Uncharacterized protein n=1 Tax=Allacma fusca TaxID=39272 RepID=A0A8J2Q6D5_9HEXA|nr:unnamed protein product [Allacma fusca]